MKIPLRFVRRGLGAVIFLASLVILYGWWTLRQTLPQLDGAITLPDLQAQVTVQRDNLGVPTITASSIKDLVIAQGYVTAQDRLWQLDFLRRVGAGELSEILGEAALSHDREMRTYGFRQAAEASLAVMDPEMKGWLEAYALGVNRYMEERRDRLPLEFRVLGYQPKPWTPVDTLLIHAYMYDVLSSTWRWELNRAWVESKVDPERAREMFVVDSELDHIIVGAQGQSSPRPKKAAALPPPQEVPAPPPVPALLAEWRRDVEAALGSNNWVVSGAHTYSGKPILANDTHLQLQIPDTWYMVHLKAPGYHAKGFALPGTPMVVIGHNERIAWGFTNNGADVQDLFTITFNPEQPQQYRFNGAWVDAEIRKEIIHVKGAADVEHDVTVTRHGPVVRQEGNTGYALRWTALEPGGLGAGYSELGFAQNWDEFLQRMHKVSGPAQNAVYADVDGNIGFVVAAWVPVRKNGAGTVPVPGDTDDYTWTGHIPFDELPRTLNPPEGIIATANARVLGPGYPRYFTDRWFSPYRTDRIYQLLQSHPALRPNDCITVQTDVHSMPIEFLAEQLQAAVKKHPPGDPRVTQLLALIPRWNREARGASPLVALLEYTRRELPRLFLEPYLGDGVNRYQWSRSQIFFDKLLRERPANWLPKDYPDYDALLVAAAERAAETLERVTRAADPSDAEKPERWRWARYIQLRILHPLARSGFLSRHLSITGLDQDGTGYSVKQTGSSIGPAMRFVADLAELDNSLMNITVGQSGQYLSNHYRDQFLPWYRGRGVPSSFSETAVEAATVHRLTLSP